MLAKKLGQGAGDANGVFGALLQTRTDWKQLLREFVTEYCAQREEASWRRANRRYLADDIYMPALDGEAIGELVIGFDTSGSCFGSAEMTRFVTEVDAIVRAVSPSKVHVAYVDTQVAGFQTFEQGQFAVQAMAPKGGGGTHLPVLFDYLQEKRITPAACVFLTDGYTDFDAAPGYPVLWAITTNVRAPWGATVTVEV
jgi:predicted metal-dependent peptidase